MPYNYLNVREEYFAAIERVEHIRSRIHGMEVQNGVKYSNRIHLGFYLLHSKALRDKLEGTLESRESEVCCGNLSSLELEV
jgi:hypothetical protein